MRRLRLVDVLVRVGLGRGRPIHPTMRAVRIVRHPAQFPADGGRITPQRPRDLPNRGGSGLLAVSGTGLRPYLPWSLGPRLGFSVNHQR